LNPERLRAVTLFTSLSDTELDQLAQSFSLRVFPAGQVVFREGDSSDYFSILLNGEVEIIKALGTPEERLLAVLGPGDFLGEMGLFDPDGRRSASARTRSAVEWAEITPQTFEDLLHRQPAISFRLLREMNLRWRRSEADTIRDLQIKNLALTRAYQELQQAQAELIQKEKLEHELELAHVIQASLLPKEIPQLAGGQVAAWQLAAHWQPARAVSGDFYDFLPYPDGRLGVLIADVTGKGMPAALVMAVTVSVLRSVVGPETSPGAILERANQLLCAVMPPNMFVTCLYALLDPASGSVRFANAGHCLPFKVAAAGAAAGAAIEPWVAGMPLGLLPGMRYAETELTLEAGSGLLLYTDGMVEAHNPQGEMFGVPRLKASLEARQFSPGVVEGLLAQLAEFTGAGWEQEDDVTFVALQRMPVKNTGTTN